MTMNRSSTAVLILCCPLVSAFVPSLSLTKRTSPLLHCSKEISKHHDEDKDLLSRSNNHVVSARTARILLPLSSSLLWSLPANAGIGSPIPFEESRKKYFPGSLNNSVINLRVSSSLRKRGYLNRNAILATPQSSDLATSLSREFSNGNVFDLNNDAIVSQEKDRLIVLFGPEVAIDGDGNVGEVTGESVKEVEKALKEKFLTTDLLSKLSQVTLLGGVVVHRPKGGKYAGEDCFQPLLIKIISGSGGETDLYDEAFGDLPTPRK